MAYQAKRSRRFQEDFELLNEEGEVIHTLHVSLDADDMVVKINRKYTALVKKMNKLETSKRETEDANELQQNLEELGAAVVDLIESVFGIEDAKTVIDFYEGRYIEMSREVLPFISTVVIPRMTEIKKQNRKDMMKKYDRKGRKILGKV